MQDGLVYDRFRSVRAVLAFVTLGSACGGAVGASGKERGGASSGDASAISATDAGAINAPGTGSLYSIPDGSLPEKNSSTADAGAATGTGTADGGQSQSASSSTSEAGATVNVDGGDGFPQWWSPDCAQSKGQCTDPNCMPVMVSVSSNVCGSFQSVSVGCLPGYGGNGAGCWVRLSDGTIIISPAAPPSPAGLVTCTQAGLTPVGSGNPIPTCHDN